MVTNVINLKESAAPCCWTRPENEKQSGIITLNRAVSDDEWKHALWNLAGKPVLSRRLQTAAFCLLAIPAAVYLDYLGPLKRTLWPRMNIYSDKRMDQGHFSCCPGCRYLTKAGNIVLDPRSVASILLATFSVFFTFLYKNKDKLRPVGMFTFNYCLHLGFITQSASGPEF